MKSVNAINDCPIALFTAKKLYTKKFKDNMCKEGEASSSKHTFGKKKRINFFHYKNKGHMIKDYKIKIVAAKIIAAKQANVIERNEKLYVDVALNVIVDKVSI
jgi:hypothetical protein